MSVTEVLEGLGSWRLQLVPETPRRIRDALGFFGHVAIVAGPVDVEASGDGLLAGARYVGVVRELPEPDEAGQQLAGSGMTFWLGDEDNKGYVIESELDLSGKTLTQAVTLILDPVNSVTIGTVHAHAGTLPAGTKFLYVSPRQALTDVCDAFGVEFRVNGNGSVDVGTQAELYQATPDAVVWRNSSGSDVDLKALTGQFDVDATVYDWSSRILMVGQTQGVEDEPTTFFVTADADLASNPFVDLFGNPVVSTRVVSDSTQTEGTAQARADLNLNRFGRIARSFTLSSADYDTEGSFSVGDMVFVYDPDSGIVNPANERMLAGRLIHPDVIRLNEATWTVKPGYTVAYRSGAGVWYDLSSFVTAETTGYGDQLVVGDLPRSLSRPGGDPLQDRIDSARTDTTIPAAPTGLTLDTEAYVTPSGETVSLIAAEWVKPTLNTDGTAYNDHSHYLVQSRWTGRAFGEGATRTESPEAELRGLTANLPHEVRVAAVDLGGKVGEWATATITTAADDIGPATPADPDLSSFLGQLRLDWSGVDADGNRMTSDTKTVNVHIGVPGFTASAANRVDALSPFGKGVGIYSWPLGEPVAVRLQAEDHTGNLSALSAEVVSETAPLGDNEIGELSVGKLIGGVLDAVVVIGQRITTALVGQRTQMEPSGWRAFDPDENLTVDINGVDNYMRGTFEAGAPGERRIIISSSFDAEHDTTGGGITFIAPDGAESYIRSYTAGGEGLSMSVPVGSGTAYASWNSVQIQDDPSVFLVSRDVDIIFGRSGTAGAGVFLVEDTTSATISSGGVRRPRYQIDPTYHQWWTATSSAGTTKRMQLGPISADALTESPILTWVNGYNFGAGIRFASTSGGASASLLVTNPAGSAYGGLTAVITDVSDESLKENIEPAVGVLDEVRRTARPVRFDWKVPGKKPGQRKANSTAELHGGRLRGRQLGLLAHEAPEGMRVDLPDGLLGISPSAGLAYAFGSIRELADSLDELRAAVAALTEENPK